MKAILTRYLGPTNHRGPRIVASDGDGNRVTISYDHDLDNIDAHRKAAHALRDKMGWHGELLSGWLKHGMAWVFIDPREIRAAAARLAGLSQDAPIEVIHDRLQEMEST